MALENYSSGFKSEAWQPEEWENEYTSSGNSVSKTAQRLLHQAQSSRHLSKQATVVDYPSFVTYLQSYQIKTVKYTEVNKGKRIGSGAVMTVYDGTVPSQWRDTRVALKVLNVELPFTASATLPATKKLQKYMAAAALELRVLSDTTMSQHPNIINLLGVSWETSSSKGFGSEDIISSIRPLLIVELAAPEHPTLTAFVDHYITEGQQIPVETKLSLLSDVADAIAVLHACGIVHGDIKPQNVLLFRHLSKDGFVAKLSDFGGCYVPVFQDDDTPVEDVDTPSMMGTAYWNAPECIDLTSSEKTPAVAREDLFARDHFCFGLLVYYVMFEKPPFGKEESVDEVRLQEISKLKCQNAVIKMVQEEMARWWKLGCQLDALQELSDETYFQKRHTLFQRHYQSGRFWELYHGEGTWSATEPYHYSLYFVMFQFLDCDPKLRRRNDLLRAFRVFTAQKDIAVMLRDIFLMNCWQDMIGLYNERMFGIWDIGNLFDETSKVVYNVGADSGKMQGQMIPMWVTRRRQVVTSSVVDFDYIISIPEDLRPLLLSELLKKAEDESEETRSDCLLTLGACDMAGYNLGLNPDRNFFEEAASLGNEYAKLYALVFHITSIRPLHVDVMTRCEWSTHALLKFIPRVDEFFNTIKDCTDVLVLECVVWKAFESQVFLQREARKDDIAELASNDHLKKITEATVSGNTIVLRNLISIYNESVHQIGIDGNSLLHIAAIYGQKATIRMLVKDYEMDINILNEDKQTPIDLAVIWDKYNSVQALQHLDARVSQLLRPELLQRLANYGTLMTIRNIHYIAGLPAELSGRLKDFTTLDYLNGRDIIGSGIEPEKLYPPVHMCLLGDNLESLSLLLDYGADPNLFSEYNDAGDLTPLHVSVCLKPMFFALLLHYGADPNVRTKNSNQSAAIHLAATARSSVNWTYPEVVRYSILPGIDNEGLGYVEEDWANVRQFMVALLVKQYEVNVDCKDYLGRTALYQILGRETPDFFLADFMITELHADINAPNFEGYTCLHEALARGADLATVRYLVDHQADVKAKSLANDTPLQLAANYASLQVCQLLVASGAEMTATEVYGNSCITYALARTPHQTQQKDSVFLWLFNRAQENNLLREMMGPKGAESRTLLIHFATLPQAPQYVWDAFESLAQEDVREIINHQDTAGLTALHHACINRNTRAIKYLLAFGATILPSQSVLGMTPLHFAYALGHRESIDILQSSEANHKETLDACRRSPRTLGEACQADTTIWQGVRELISELGRQNRIWPLGLDPDARKQQVEAAREANAPKRGWWKL